MIIFSQTYFIYKSGGFLSCRKSDVIDRLVMVLKTADMVEFDLEIRKWLKRKPFNVIFDELGGSAVGHLLSKRSWKPSPTETVP